MGYGALQQQKLQFVHCCHSPGSPCKHRTGNKPSRNTEISNDVLTRTFQATLAVAFFLAGRSTAS